MLRAVAQAGSALRSGRRGRRFESCQLDYVVSAAPSWGGSQAAPRGGLQGSPGGDGCRKVAVAARWEWPGSARCHALHSRGWLRVMQGSLRGSLEGHSRGYSQEALGRYSRRHSQGALRVSGGGVRRGGRVIPTSGGCLRVPSSFPCFQVSAIPGVFSSLLFFPFSRFSFINPPTRYVRS